MPRRQAEAATAPVATKKNFNGGNGGNNAVVTTWIPLIVSTCALCVTIIAALFVLQVERRRDPIATQTVLHTYMPLFFGPAIDSAYPNYQSKSGYLFLEPPRRVCTNHQYTPRAVRLLRDMLDWTVGECPDQESTLAWTKRASDEKKRRLVPSTGRMQLINWLPDDDHIATKGMMAADIRAHYLTAEPSLNLQPVRLYDGTSAPPLKMSQFLPETFDVKNVEECLMFFGAENRPGVWLAKETHNSMGRGIIIFEHFKDYKAQFKVDVKNRICHRTYQYPVDEFDPEDGEVAQKYIENPLLLEGKKSETRAYWLVASMNPFIVLFYAEGTVRVTSTNWTRGDWGNRLKHLTNVHQQKEHENFDEIQDSLKWNYERYENYLEENGLVPRKSDWVHTELQKRLKIVISRIFNATKSHLGAADGHFQLFGADFILDDQLNPFLLELQGGPGMSITGIKKDVIVPMLLETVDVVLEVEHRKANKMSLRTFETLKKWSVFHNEALY